MSAPFFWTLPFTLTAVPFAREPMDLSSVEQPRRTFRLFAVTYMVSSTGTMLISEALASSFLTAVLVSNFKTFADMIMLQISGMSSASAEKPVIMKTSFFVEYTA